jgi:hypothetical protein
LSSSSDNAGLVETTSLVNTILEPIWQKYCNLISRADFWALIGKIAVETSVSASASISIPYQYGRIDSTTCSDLSRLPSAQKGLSGIQAVFVDRMGLTLTDAGSTFTLFFKNKYFVLNM